MPNDSGCGIGFAEAREQLSGARWIGHWAAQLAGRQSGSWSMTLQTASSPITPDPHLALSSTLLH